MLADASRPPAGLNATLETQPVWPLSANSSLPVPLSQNLTAVLSSPADARRPAIRTERDAQYATGMTFDGEQLFPARAVPDLHRLVKARRRQAPAVGAERHARDR